MPRIYTLVCCLGALASTSVGSLAAQQTYLVDSNADPGNGTCDPDACTLREAITAANNDGVASTIEFGLPGSTVITLGSFLDITAPVVIDGTTQSGWALGVPVVEIRGSAAGFVGLNIASGGQGSTIKDLIIRDFSTGIVAQGGSNFIEGNFIGTTPSNDNTLGNSVGISLESDGNTVGGTAAGARNVVSNNSSHGIQITGAAAFSNVVAGNYIGTLADGSAALGNGGSGVHVELGAAGNTIGGVGATSRNVISGNARGISLDGSGGGVANNEVLENYIGTDATGSSAVPNAAEGVRIDQATGTVVRGNVISGNVGSGVYAGPASAVNTSIETNNIGTSASGTAHVPNGNYGIDVDAAPSIAIGGDAGKGNVVAGHGLAAIRISNGASGATIQGNYVGTNTGGTGDLGNGIGILVEASGNATIGGASPRGNLISGNTDGIRIDGASSTSTVIEGNLIGTDANGTADLGNSANGIVVTNGASGAGIGSATVGLGNVISGNDQNGILLDASNNTVYNNLIGVDMGGSTALGNSGDGVEVSGSGNAIGGSAANQSNIIANSSGIGVHVASGTGNRISSNSIFGNANLGIDLGGDGVTPNDSLNPMGPDADTGPNDLQDFPTFNAVYLGSTIIDGRLISTPSTNFTIEFYSSPSCDASGHGQGVTLLQSLTDQTDASGVLDFTVVEATSLAPGSVVTATATNNSTNSTSEFSMCETVADFSVAVMPTSATVDRGDQTSTTVTVATLNGVFEGLVTLSCSGLPSLAQCQFSTNNQAPGSTSWTSTLTITADIATPNGTYNIDVIGTSGSVQHTAVFALTVQDPPPVPTFAVAATPPTQSVAKGGSVTYTVDVTSVNGDFNNPVALTCAAGLPTGVSCAFNPTPVTPGASGAQSTLTVSTTDPSTPVGSFTITIQGMSGGDTKTTTVDLDVTAPPTFALAASPSTRTVIQGSSASYTVDVTSVNGPFNNPVALVCLGGLPTGVSCSFNPTPVTPGAGGMASALTVSTTAATPPGTVTITIQGSSGSDTETATVSLTVNLPPTFAIAATPSSRTVGKGVTASYTINVTSVNGTFTDLVDFSCTGALPSGVSCGFNPMAIRPGAFGETVSLSVSTTNPDTPEGTWPITIEGTSGSTVRTTNVDLIVTAAPSFTIAASPATLVVPRAGSVDATVTVTPSGTGSPGTVTFSCGQSPAGASCSFSPAAVTPTTQPLTSTLTITTTDPATPAGSATVVVVGASPSLQGSDNIALTISDFTIAVDPTSKSVIRGGTLDYTVTIGPTSPSGSFDEEVTLACSNLPTQATCTFSPTMLTPGAADQQVALAVTTAQPETPSGVASFNIDASAGPLQRTTSADMDVTKDFTVAVTPELQTVTGGESTTYTITIGQSGYFDEPVALSCANLPTGASCAFEPDSVTPNGSEVTTVLTLSTAVVSSALRTKGRGNPMLAFWLALPLLGLPALGFVNAATRRKRSGESVRWGGGRRSVPFLLLGVLLGYVVLAACGGEPTQPVTTTEIPGPTTTTFTVMGTAGQDSRSATASITIFP